MRVVHSPAGTTKVRFDQVFGIIEKSAKAVIKKRTYALKEDIVRAWPVKSGRSKAGWKVWAHRAGWTISNHVVSPEGHDYVPNLWVGLPLGSRQLPNGGDPIVQRHVKLLRKGLKGMNFDK